MRPSGAWLGRLVMAGSCLAWAGCGGGDVPDPDSDASAAADQPSKVVDKGAEPAAEPAAPQAPRGPAKPSGEATGPKAPVAAEAAVARAEPPVASTPAPTVAEVEKPATTDAPAPAQAPALKGDASGTEEMMRIASAPPAPADAPPTASTPSPAPAPAPNPPIASAAPTAPGMAPGSPRNDIGSLGRGAFGAAENPPGGASQAVATRPGAFNQPAGAVDAFLSALRSKNKDQLAEATARRSATEAEEKHRKIFAEIIEGSISDVELDEMSKAMEGYRISYQLPAKSTGRIGVVVSKQQGRDLLQRTVITRKERDGWKVMDIEGAYDFKPVGNYRRSGRR